MTRWRSEVNSNRRYRFVNSQRTASGQALRHRDELQSAIGLQRISSAIWALRERACAFIGSLLRHQSRCRSSAPSNVADGICRSGIRALRGDAAARHADDEPTPAEDRARRHRQSQDGRVCLLNLRIRFRASPLFRPLDDCRCYAGGDPTLDINFHLRWWHRV
jgi:hypothetical protein